MTPMSKLETELERANLKHILARAHLQRARKTRVQQPAGANTEIY
jgi:hypothetical protein